jgi:hypothetical protein
MVSGERAGAGAGPTAILQQISAPALRCVFDSPRSIAPAVEAVLGPRGLAGRARSLTPKTLDMVGLATMEVLHTVLEHCGDQRAAGGASVELWVEPGLAVLVVGHAGPALPDWLIANWDRGEEPGVPDASTGWGWLLVREALDGVSAGRCGDRRLLFLEKRL